LRLFDRGGGDEEAAMELIVGLVLVARGERRSRLRLAINLHLQAGTDTQSSISRDQLGALLRSFQSVAMVVVKVLVASIVRVCGNLRCNNSASSDDDELVEKLTRDSRNGVSVLQLLWRMSVEPLLWSAQLQNKVASLSAVAFTQNGMADEMTWCEFLLWIVQWWQTTNIKYYRQDFELWIDGNADWLDRLSLGFIRTVSHVEHRLRRQDR
jgi:hypothetical protein